MEKRDLFYVISFTTTAREKFMKLIHSISTNYVNQIYLEYVDAVRSSGF